jgi:hypothetical protein
MARAGFILKTSVFLLLTSLSAAGCSSATVGTQPEAFSQLRTIAQVYYQATDSLDRPPKGKDDLKEILKERGFQDIEAFYRSKNDGEEFVIFWDVDVREYNTRGKSSKTMPVLAYEKNGKNGKRLVVQLRQYVHEVNDEEFASLPFPKGQKAP